MEVLFLKMDGISPMSIQMPPSFTVERFTTGRFKSQQTKSLRFFWMASSLVNNTKHSNLLLDVEA